MLQRKTRVLRARLVAPGIGQMACQPSTEGAAMKRWIIGVVIVVLLIAGGLWMRREFAIDRCLDAGGSWNGEAGICDR